MYKIMDKKKTWSGFGRVVLGFAIVVGAATMPSAAYALGVGEVLDNITKNFQSFVPLIELSAYIAGIFLAVTGLIKMKTSVENPQSGGVGPALVRLVLGAFLIALPSVIGVIIGTADLEVEDSAPDNKQWDTFS